MCLITFNWRNHHRYKLILVANRDEFFGRPTAPLHQWENGVYAGKDLKGGGTWMGLHPSGKFAALTNYRDLDNLKEQPISRGKLVKDFLESDMAPKEYLERVKVKKDDYDGFNLLVGDGEQLWYYSNYAPSVEMVLPGLHGLSNALLDVPWKKVVDGKRRLAKQIQLGGLSMKDLAAVQYSQVEDKPENLPKTGVTIEVEQALSAAFIRDIQGYGTVNVSVLLWGVDGEVRFLEQQVNKNGIISSEEKLSFFMT
ncbi:hypothetical protein DN752_15705 [Echinicola strongylocentroti]|uniref:NRDE family protein n=1 Tax=Echinicola strongylocentroti TaxID=1795355 RepID=A0A2Z4IJZ7_9BACT|nr:NRDE family protein [Echinicola strongylocentroti]AWW31451.1 hypothetical protein DN752_15705 [Echinicola strongylocentroti]